MIVLKELAREFNLEPYVMRRILRNKFGLVKGRRWHFEGKHLEKIKAYLRSMPLSKKQIKRKGTS